jgi:hypothetical protein
MARPGIGAVRPPDRLTPLQRIVLRTFFAAERGFFLSGGGALVGFYLGHRETTDLDLFTTSSEAFDRARVVRPNVVAAFGGKLVTRQDAPGFRRVVVQRGDEQLVVDVVREVEPQLHPKQGPRRRARARAAWPAGYPVGEVRAFKDGLAERMAMTAHPAAGG